MTDRKKRRKVVKAVKAWAIAAVDIIYHEHTVKCGPYVLFGTLSECKAYMAAFPAWHSDWKPTRVTITISKDRL